MNFTKLKDDHNRLLKEWGIKNFSVEFIKAVHDHLEHIAEAGELTYLNSERELLLADIRFWSSVLFDIEKHYTVVQLHPVKSGLDLIERLERFRSSLKIRGDLHKAIQELTELTFLLQEQQSNQYIQNQLAETQNLLQHRLREQRTLVEDIRSGNISKIEASGNKIEELMSYGVTEIFDEIKQEVIPITQVMAGVQAWLQIQNIEEIMRQIWAQIITLLSSSKPNTEQWQTNFDQVESIIKNTDDVSSFLGSNFNKKVQKFKTTLVLQQELYKRCQKIAQESVPTQKAVLLKNMITENEHFISDDLSLSNRLREIGCREVPAIIEQAKINLEQKNYSEAISNSSLVLYFMPEYLEAVSLYKHATQAETEQKKQEIENRQLENELLQAIQSPHKLQILIENRQLETNLSQGSQPPRDLVTLRKLILKTEMLERQQTISIQGQEILRKARQVYSELEQQEIEYRRLENNLLQASYSPHNLAAFRDLILKVETLENQRTISLEGQEILKKARQIYEERLKYYRELTLKIHNGTLQEHFEALNEIRRLVVEGETQILDVIVDTWRPASKVLVDAEHNYQLASIKHVDEILQKAEELFKIRSALALKMLYAALDKKFPYTEADRRRLESYYIELYCSHGQFIQPSQADQAGHKLVQQLYEQRLKQAFNSGAGWLNQFFHSSIGDNTASLLKIAASEDTAVLRAFELIGMAVDLARNRMEGSIEIPEVMVKGAVILCNKELPEYARDLLAEARPLYALDRTDKIHRHAVTSWLKGCLEYYLGRRLIGYTDWKDARSLFNELLGEARREKHTEQAQWYQSRLAATDIWVTQTFEEVYFQWMNQFEPMPLTGALYEYHKIMDSQFGNKRYRELRKTIQLFLRDSKLAPTPQTAWFALVEAAFFEYQMRDILTAIAHLKEARDGFQFTHRGAVILWLLGMLRWWLPSQRSDAVLNWEESIALFRTLGNQADQANRQDQRRWYDTQINLMTTSLAEWINLTKPR